MLLVGILLVLPLALLVVEVPAYYRGGYDSAFWALPIDEKLDHIAGHARYWWWLSILGLVGIIALIAGVTGLAGLIVDSGQTVISFVALGVFVPSAMAWIFGSIVQTGAMPQAAKQRTASGETPPWVHPLWSAAWTAEITYIVGANIAYAIFGYALLDFGIAEWVGWVAIVGGLLTALAVVVLRNGFPQLAILLPGLIGVALILS